MQIQALSAKSGFDEIVEAYKSTVYALALTRTRNRHDADDVFQEVFLTYYRKQPKFNNEEHRKAWLINVTLKCAKKFLSKNRRENLPFDEASAPVYELASKEDSEVYEALCSLPEKYRTVLYLYYFEDLPVNDISKMLKIRPGTLRMQMTRGREILKELIERDFCK